MVLQKLAYRADAAVAEMDDVISLADDVIQADKIVDRRHHIILDYVARYELLYVFINIGALLIVAHALRLGKYAHESGIMYLFVYSRFLRVKVDIAGSVYEVVADHAYALFFGENIYAVHTRVLNAPRRFAVYLDAFLGYDFTRLRIDYVLRRNMPRYTIRKRKLFVEFIASYPCKVKRVEKRCYKGPALLLRRRLAGGPDVCISL